MIASSAFLALLFMASATAQNYFFTQSVYAGQGCTGGAVESISYAFFLNECRNSRTYRLVGSDLVIDWYSTSNCATNTYVGTDYSFSSLPSDGCQSAPDANSYSYKTERLSGKFPYNTLAQNDKVTVNYDDLKCSGDISYIHVEKAAGCVQNQACHTDTHGSVVFCGDSFRFPSDAAGLTQSATRTAQIIDTASSTVSEVTSRDNSANLTTFTETRSGQSTATVTVSAVRSSIIVPKGSETFSRTADGYSYASKLETYIRTLKSGTVGRLQSGSYTFYSNSVRLGFSFLFLAFFSLALLF